MKYGGTSQVLLFLSVLPGFRWIRIYEPRYTCIHTDVGRARSPFNQNRAKAATIAIDIAAEMRQAGAVVGRLRQSRSHRSSDSGRGTSPAAAAESNLV